MTVVSISYAAASFVYISYRVGNFSSEVKTLLCFLCNVSVQYSVKVLSHLYLFIFLVGKQEIHAEIY